MTDLELISRATAVLKPRQLSPSVEVAGVASALVTGTGAVHVGVCIDTACSLGFCAEHSAIASMITQGESHIHTIVAVGSNGKVKPPCGRCRELICQVDLRNTETRILLPAGKVATLCELLPEHWLPKPD